MLLERHSDCMRRFLIPAATALFLFTGLCLWLNTLHGSTEISEDLFIPIVLSSAGQGSSFYTSELTLTNRSRNDVTIIFTYSAAFGGGSGSASDSLRAGTQKIIPDAIEYLRTLGIPIPGTGSRGGTLRLRCSGNNSTSEVGATLRTTTPAANGRAGLSYVGLPISSLLTGTAYLCGLRQNELDRSNIAIQNAGLAGDGNITLRLTVISGDPTAPSSLVLSETLPPGGFRQITNVLHSNGLSISNGYIRIERVEGNAPYYAYAVINDQANSDGSFVTPILDAAGKNQTGLFLPVVTETSTFNSELILTNWSSLPKTISLTFWSDSVRSQFGSVNAGLTLAAGQQSIFPNALQFIRDQGNNRDLIPSGVAYAGLLTALVQASDVGSIFLAARTSSPGGGGRFGVFYDAIPAGMSEGNSTWIYGVQQNSETRTNFAIINTGSSRKSVGAFGSI